MDRYQVTILNELLDKYEGSKSFIDKNRIAQNFYLDIGKAFPKYLDDADYETFSGVNDAVKRLVEFGYIQVSKQRNDTIQKVVLEFAHIEDIYAYIKRSTKREEHAWLHEVLAQYKTLDHTIGRYANIQLEKLSKNQKVEYYDGNKQAFEKLLYACTHIIGNQKEIYIRDLSIDLFQDSKYLKTLESKIQSLLYKYGEYDSKEYVFEECGVVQTPTYVIVKGNGIIEFPGQSIDLRLLGSDISMSTKTIEKIESIEVHGNRVVTIENLTSFHDYEAKDDFCIYLGGFHNQVKAQLLQKIYRNNQEKSYLHFGDIDVGGFYIFEHLIEKTKIPFKTMNMDVAVLVAHQNSWIKLTQNDHLRLVKLMKKIEDNAEICEYASVLQFMKDHNCKMEQEAVGR